MSRPDKLTFAISGIACPDCISVIENAALSLKGVDYVGVSLSGGTMTIRPGPGLDLPRLISTITALGYIVEPATTGQGGVAGLTCPCRR
ncbi:heavy-metal-associated domain-containing protein [Devosia submarina]|uniref:heavy-metal-associated domain-containing protein n=1 Tax=Devosia submarina TaxID=1173082 RepID=UPI000D33CE59|nr:heavy-metal-associated domain-containing protein [Devosia submarina]